MDHSRIRIINGKIITPEGVLPEGYVLSVKDSRIESIEKDGGVPEDAVTIDAQGKYIAPGGIDLHIHGGGGKNFTEATEEAFYKISRAHTKYGTTSMYATIEATPDENLFQLFDICNRVMHSPGDGARIIGLHLEGNYLNPQMKGGMNPLYLKLPEPQEYERLVNASNGCIKRRSVSPELEGALEFGEYISRQGIVPSIAHTTAGYPIVKAAFEAGYRHVTHFYNAMTSVHKNREFKKEGTVEAIYLIDDLTVELVADGVHVPPAILKLVHKIKGVERIALITDAMAAAVLPDHSVFQDERLIIEDGVCKLADGSALAGSIATMDRLIHTMVEQAEIPLTDAVRMVSEAPARIMGIYDRKGSLEKGKDADIILFDQNIHVTHTLVEGKVVYQENI